MKTIPNITIAARYFLRTCECIPYNIQGEECVTLKVLVKVSDVRFGAHRVMQGFVIKPTATNDKHLMNDGHAVQKLQSFVKALDKNCMT